MLQMKKRKRCGKNKIVTVKNDAAAVVNEITTTPSHDHVEMLEGLFPSGCQWLIFGATLCFRMMYVTNKKNWWILHPDEIYQSMEVAHSEIYGYGFRPYEYLQPPTVNQSSFLPVQQYHSMGMYSMRSFLYPQIFILVQQLVMTVWPDAKPFLVWKLFHAVVTSTLPLVVYRFSNNLYGSHDIAVVGSFLCAFSLHLNVLGTHTLVNSFLSPGVLYSLDVFTQTIQKNNWNVKTGDLAAEIKKCDKVRNYTTDDIAAIKNNATNNTKKEIEFDKIFESLKSQLRSQLCIFQDIYCLCRESTNCVEQARSDGRRLSSNYGSVLRLSQNTSFILLMNAIFSQDMFAGLLLGVSVYMRVDLIIFVSVFALTNLFTLWRNLNIVTKLRTFVFGSCVGIFIGGFDDSLTYGTWFISPMQWIKFNILGNLSVYFFGEGSRILYVKEMFGSNYFLTAFFILSSIHTGISLLPHNRKFYHKQNWKLLFIIISLLIAYSSSGHKEIRFVHNIFVVMFIFYGSAVIGVMQYFYASICKAKLVCRLILYVSLFLYVFGQAYKFPTSENKLISSWTFQQCEDSSDVNECLDFVSQQNDVNGIFMDRSIYIYGGYTIIHKNVPILSLIHQEFYELDRSSRITVETGGILGWGSANVSVSSLQHISDFISVQNTPYLLKILIKKTEYNYLIMKLNRKFIDFGYTEVFRSGTMKVLRRSFSKDTEVKLCNTGNAIPLGRDAKVLEFESGWLISFGLYDIAEEKLYAAISLDSTRVGLFQLLAELYYRTERVKKRKSILQSCAKLHGLGICKTPVLKTEFPRERNY